MKLQPAPAKTFDQKIEHLPIDIPKPFGKNARVHPVKQISQVAASIERFGFLAPILLDEDDTVLAGHARLAAARTLGMTAVPCIRSTHLTAADKRAFVIADNRLAQLSGWDEDILASELRDLATLDLDFDLELTGYDGAELDRLLGLEFAPKIDPKADQIPEAVGPAITRLGDLWIMGQHQLICADARDALAYERLMQGKLARMTISDPPFNVKIDGHVGGKGRIARRPFVMGSGEMSKAAFTAFLTDVLTLLAAAGVDGSIHYVFMDWRHLAELLAAGETAYDELKNLIVWCKENAGMGAFYRSQHELIAVFKKGDAPHLNTFGLGEHGRHRSNVWTYPGLNSFGAGRDEALALHATVKPAAMIADAIKDVTRRGDLVLDAFGGSGTTLIAAEKTKRHARLIELDPLYCDTACRRWQAFSNGFAVLDGDGRTFDEIAAERCGSAGGGDHGQT
jgi:DNA modification methylase